MNQTNSTPKPSLKIITLMGIVIILFMNLIRSAHAIDPLPNSCQFDEKVLTCFFPYQTELRDFHYTQLDQIAERIAKSFDGQRPLNKIRLVGHGSTFKATDPTEANALARAVSAEEALVLRLSRLDLPLDDIDLTTSGASDDEPRFSNSSREGRAYNRRVEVYLYHVAASKPKEEPDPGSLVFSKDSVKEKRSELFFPSDMPPPRFPIYNKHCEGQEKQLDEAWALAHYYMWRMDQVMDWLESHPAKREEAWKSKSVKHTDNPSPRAWFGPYHARRFANVDNAVERIFHNRFLGKTFKVVCKTKLGKTGASHNLYGRIVFYDDVQTYDLPTRALFVVHEMYHGLALRNGTWVMDTHSLCSHPDIKGCKTEEHYDEMKSLQLSYGTRKRHYRLAIRNNDNYAYFAKNLGEAIRNGKLPVFPPK